MRFRVIYTVIFNLTWKTKPLCSIFIKILILYSCPHVFMCSIPTITEILTTGL